MAWRAELKRRKWYCIIETNMIQIFGKIRYDEWYNSLTDEQKIQLEMKEAEDERRRKEELNLALAKLMILPSLINNIYEDKYHGIYDKNGFPKR